MRWLAVWIVVFPLAAFSDTVSELESFEKDATTPRSKEGSGDPPPKQSKRPEPYSSTDDSGEGQPDFIDYIMDGLFQAIPKALAAGGLYSWERVSTPALSEGANPGEPADNSPRAFGEGVIPYLRLDASYNRIDGNIHARDYRAEAGYGPFGFEYRTQRYTETNPQATLELEQYHALYRMSFGDHIEVDLGYGRLNLIGRARHSASSWTLPILIYPSPRFGIEFRPSWARINGNLISNQEVAVSVGSSFWALRSGYHWLESPGESLSGPFIGLSFRY